MISWAKNNGFNFSIGVLRTAINTFVFFILGIEWASYNEVNELFTFCFEALEKFLWMQFSWFYIDRKLFWSQSHR